MTREQIDLILKAIMVLLLTIFTIVLFVGIREFKSEAGFCVNNPIEYVEQKGIEKGLYCFCECQEQKDEWFFNVSFK